MKEADFIAVLDSVRTEFSAGYGWGAWHEQEMDMVERVLARIKAKMAECQCEACQIAPHASSCAVHNAPALPVGPCNCKGEG